MVASLYYVTGCSFHFTTEVLSVAFRPVEVKIIFRSLYQILVLAGILAYFGDYLLCLKTPDYGKQQTRNPHDYSTPWQFKRTPKNVSMLCSVWCENLVPSFVTEYLCMILHPLSPGPLLAHTRRLFCLDLNEMMRQINICCIALCADIKKGFRLICCVQSMRTYGYPHFNTYNLAK